MNKGLYESHLFVNNLDRSILLFVQIYWGLNNFWWNRNEELLFLDWKT